MSKSARGAIRLPRSVRLMDGSVDSPGWRGAALRSDSWLAARWKRYVRSIDALDMWHFGDPDAPMVEGVYFLWSAEFDLLYIGMSVDVPMRLIQHKHARRIPFAYFSVIEVDMASAPDVELAYICALTPPHNKKFGPVRWFGHNRMSRLIARVWRSALFT
jgi:hypothetical protein